MLLILLIFLLFNWVGGDPAYILAGKMANAEQIENIRQQLGVDQPYYVHPLDFHLLLCCELLRS